MHYEKLYRTKLTFRQQSKCMCVYMYICIDCGVNFVLPTEFTFTYKNTSRRSVFVLVRTYTKSKFDFTSIKFRINYIILIP
jgi:hypothetical protein